jgi:hypothetical protein
MLASPRSPPSPPRRSLYIGQHTAGQILVASPEGKLLRSIAVPSAAAPNLAFSPGRT